MARICDLDADVRACGSNQLNEELNASMESQSPHDSLCVRMGAAGKRILHLCYIETEKSTCIYWGGSLHF